MSEVKELLANLNFCMTLLSLAVGSNDILTGLLLTGIM